MENGKADNAEVMAEQLVQAIEADTGQEVFTTRMLAELEDGLEILVVFKNKSILMGELLFQPEDDGLMVRIRGDFI